MHTMHLPCIYQAWPEGEMQVIVQSPSAAHTGRNGLYVNVTLTLTLTLTPTLTPTLTNGLYVKVT